jgi:hypothetical protein
VVSVSGDFPLIPGLADAEPTLAERIADVFRATSITDLLERMGATLDMTGEELFEEMKRRRIARLRGESA